MIYAATPTVITAFWLLVAVCVSAAFYASRRSRAAQSLESQPHWLVRSVARGTEGISGAMLLGTCGLIAFYGYDGFLYAIGFVAGFFAALFAAPLARRAASDPTSGAAFMARFSSPAARTAAALSALVICLLLLAAEVNAAAVLLTPMLGGAAASSMLGILAAGAIALLPALRPGTGTAWPGFLTAILLLLVCGGLAAGVVARGLSAPKAGVPRILPAHEFQAQLAPTDSLLPNTGPWANRYFARVQHADGSLTLWRYWGMENLDLSWPAAVYVECQVVTTAADGRTLLNNLPHTAVNDLRPAGFVASLPHGEASLKPANPLGFLQAVQESNLALPRSETVSDAAGTHTIYYPHVVYGQDFFLPGQMPRLFPALAAGAPADRLNFASLMLALFCGGAAMGALRQPAAAPDNAKSRATAIGVVGLLFLLTLFLGVGALVQGRLDPTASNAAANLLAASFGNPAWLLFSLAALALVSGTMRQLLIPATESLRDLLSTNRGTPTPRTSPAPLIALATAAILLAILLRHLNLAFLVGWTLNIAAAAIFPAITMPLLWKRTTQPGIATAIFVGLVSTLGWILLSGDLFEFLYGQSAAAKMTTLPFNQPAIVTLPLACIVSLIVSLLTQKTELAPLPSS